MAVRLRAFYDVHTITGKAARMGIQAWGGDDRVFGALPHIQ